MSVQGVISNRTSQPSSPPSDYTWEYEYYEIGPVSFEGLKAHRYSIVIGFWVGLAVFVIFMFFVLMLLTKTGAPHQENTEPSEKRFRMDSLVPELGGRAAPEADRAFSRHVPDESRSLFHCYIGGVEPSDRAAVGPRATGLGGGVHLQEALGGPGRGEDDLNGLLKFNIPNFVNTDPGSSLGEDDLPVSGAPMPLENRPGSQASHTVLD
ncbi:melanocortin-2 receptor accessory protein 2 [Tachyglossus aculeatus]|uniref:melanocortin-2 receptor accessory protein 2 n=1 Tax=Tachyglossus aculeatus TaxID=9261 RepID=UPI0018F3F881|nr:melanocortin-2 receptor accessory protein 2 [Tachyglossus aculeatus]XP_038617264.1 melanocortin-2 receptor accessory protein 2 [Tachyglossus aculeatus]